MAIPKQAEALRLLSELYEAHEGNPPIPAKPNKKRKTEVLAQEGHGQDQTLLLDLSRNEDRKMRGYFGVVLYQPKHTENWGTVLRSAFNFGAAFVGTVNRRFTQQSSNTVKAERHIPVFHWDTVDAFLDTIPINSLLVGLEVNGQHILGNGFCHPERCVYIFGGEDQTLPANLWDFPRSVSVRIETRNCLNLAVAASIVMWDRTRNTQR